MSEGGWQACMSSWCAKAGGASATGEEGVTPTLSVPDTTVTSPIADEASEKKRRQEESPPVTGSDPAETGTPSEGLGGPSGHGSGYVPPHLLPLPDSLSSSQIRPQS